MSKGWSDSDKAAVKRLLEVAEKNAEAEALKLFKHTRVENISDLWNLELEIRKWKKERYGVFYFSYDRVEEQISEYLERGWLKESDLSSLSQKRRENIK